MARILLASSDAASLDVLSSEVSGDGHEVLEAVTGLEAYEMTLAEEPDMVFLTVPLSVFNGYETCEMLRQDPDVSPTLPIIFLVKEDVDKRRLENIGATGVLPTIHQGCEVSDLLVEHIPAEAL